MQWRYRYTVLALMTAALFGTVTARLAISPLVPDLVSAFGTSNGVIGLVLTGMWATYAVFQLPGGVLAGRYGERTLVLAALAFTGIGSVLLSVSPSLPVFAAVAVGLGAGAGFYFPAGSGLLTREFRQTGQALGFHEAGASLAGLLAPVAAAAIAVRFGFRAALLVGVVVVPIFLLVLALIESPASRFDDDGPSGRSEPTLDPRALARLLTNPAIASTVILAIASAFVWQGVASFFPTFLVDHRGMALGPASVAFGGIFAVATVSLPLVGRLSDVVGRDTALAGTFVLSAGGLVVALEGPGPLAPFVGAAIIGAGFGWPAAIQSRFMDHLTPTDRTVGFGLVRTVYLTLGSTGSAVTGAVADLAGWRAAIGLLAGLFFVAAAALVFWRLLGSVSGYSFDS